MGMLGQVLLVTAAAGIGGTGLGGGAACLFRRDSSRTVSLLLSFAAGVMVAVVCFDLLAEAAPGRMPVTTVGILAGYGVTAGLNRALERRERTEERSSLLLAGVVMAAAIALHNVPEGMVIGTAFAGGEAGSGWLLAAVLSLASGAMLYVVFAELLPEAAGLWQSKLPALAAVLGMIVGMAITLGHG